MSSPGGINSFAVFDLETTGLPSYNFNKANITELTIHGFPAESVWNASAVDNRRVNHSLTLVFNPRMMISQGAEDITGLSNYMLEKESSFDENAATIVISFLKHLRQPVCLVAHNGDRFDFPILKDAFKKLKMELPPDVLCLDSYKAIVNLDKILEPRAADNDGPLENEDFTLNPLPVLNNDESPSITTDNTAPSQTTTDDFKQPDHILKHIKTEAASPPQTTADDFKQPDRLLEHIKTEAPSITTGNTAPSQTTLDDLNRISENVNTENIKIKSEEDDTRNPTDWQKINETTPKHGIKNRPTLSKKSKTDSRLSNPPKQRRLNFSTPTQAANPPRPPVGFYKLENIYIRLFGVQPRVTHQAEADVILLKDIIYKYGDSFVKWAEKNAKPFSSVKPLSGF